MAYDVATDAGKVRLLISDVGGEDESTFLFDDDEIDAFLSMEGDSIYLAAATALRTIANNEAQVSKRIQILELATDGPAVAKSLMSLAQELEKKGETDHEVDFAQWGITPSARREIEGWRDNV